MDDKVRELDQSVKKDDYPEVGAGGMQLLIPTYGIFGNDSYKYQVLPEDIPPYNRYAFFSLRDIVQLMTPHHESYWASSIAIATSKAVSWGFEITSDIPLRRKRVQDLLRYSTVGGFVGYPQFMSAHIRSYLCTGKAIVEIEREGKDRSSKIIALHHLNPLRCLFTDDPETPILYQDRKGRIHELKYWQVMTLGDMVDPTEGEYGLVQAAAERAYKKIILMAGMERYLYEKITGKRITAMHFIQGITSNVLQKSLQSTDMEQEKLGAWVYKGASAIPIPGDIPLNLVTIPFAEIPDGFNAQQERDEAKIAYAGAIGEDVNDVDPRLGQSRNLGSGAQSLIMHEKAKGKGMSAWRTQFKYALNMLIDDIKVSFAWSEESLDDDKKKAEIREKNANWTKSLQEQGIANAEQATNLLVDAGDLPRDFIQEEEAGGNTVQDDEKPQTPQNGDKKEDKPNDAPSMLDGNKKPLEAKKEANDGKSIAESVIEEAKRDYKRLKK